MAGEMDYEMAQVYRKAIFSLVENKDNWKNPIDAIVTIPTAVPCYELIEAIIDAVTHFVGAPPTIKQPKLNQIRIISPGYYAIVGA